MTSEVMTIVPSETDAKRAEEIRSKLLKKLEEVCAIMDEASKEWGLEVNFQIAQGGPRLMSNGKITPGPRQVQFISVSRPL